MGTLYSSGQKLELSHLALQFGLKVKTVQFEHLHFEFLEQVWAYKQSQAENSPQAPVC